MFIYMRLNLFSRPLYSNPPRHGARIAAEVDKFLNLRLIKLSDLAVAWLCNWQFNLPRLWPTLPWEKNGWKMLRPWQTGSQTSPDFNLNWYGNVIMIKNWFRIIDMRTALRDGLAKEGSSRNWQHITDQVFPERQQREAPNWSLISLESSSLHLKLELVF